jgi:hypothetical protein
LKKELRYKTDTKTRNRAAELWKTWKSFWEKQKEFSTGRGCRDTLPDTVKRQRSFQEAAADWDVGTSSLVNNLMAL